MFEKNDKRRLYWLIEMYLREKMNSNEFEDEFYYCYDLEGGNELTKLEERYFGELSKITGRFLPFQQDHEEFPNVNCTEIELRDKVIETKNALKYENPLYQLLFDVIEKLPQQDVKNIIMLIDNFDWFLAVETLCIQLYQNKIPISKELCEKISEFGDKVGVDPFICLLLNELVKENI